MYFKQFYLSCLSHASYLIADEETKDAVVVDPQRDIEQYLEEAESKGFSIKYVLLTHFHADFLAGHLELRDRGAQIMLGAEGRAEYDFRACHEGDKIELGSVTLSFLETPGHTPEGISILVFDKSHSSEKPWAVLTGDTLFVGDVGRPDLLSSEGFSSEQMAEQLYDSLHGKLLKLPDETLMYPAHGAGSMCGKNLGKESFSTIGEQKKFNYALRIPTKPEFVKSICADQPETPAYFKLSSSMNKMERQLLHENLPRALKPIQADQITKLQDEGAQILDTRGPSEFSKGHLKGSINIGLSGNYAVWAGTILDHQKPIILVVDPGKEQEAALQLGRIGYDNVLGFVEGGAPAFLFRNELVTQLDRLTAVQLNEELHSSAPPRVLDVRTNAEWNDKHIEGAIHIPLNQLNRRLQEVPRDKPLVLHCLGGYRSMIAASVLTSNGIEDVRDLIGGINAWTEQALPVVQGNVESSCGS